LGIFRGRRELDRFQSELREYFNVRHCFLVSSGKAALTLTLLALKELFPGRNGVLIPAFTCFSVPSSIVRAGLDVRLCDVRADNLEFDLAQLRTILSGSGGPHRNAASARVVDNPPARSLDSNPGEGGSAAGILAVVPTHLFGIPVDVAKLRELIRDPEITIIEDAAQAMGEIQSGKKLGTLGDVGFFSLGRGKAFSVVEGGVILTDRDDIAEKLGRLANRLPSYGLLPLLGLILRATALIALIRPRIFWIPKSLPFVRLGETFFEPEFPMRKMSSFQAGLARSWQNKLGKLRQTRKRNVDRWQSFLEALKCGGLSVVRPPSLGLVRFPIRIRDSEKRDSLLRKSTVIGMGIMPAYPTSIDAIPELQGRIGAGAFPVAESCARELVTLPTHGFVTEADAADVKTLLSSVLD